MPFSEKAVHYKDRVEFTNRMTQDQLQSQELRELKRGLDQNSTEPQEELKPQQPGAREEDVHKHLHERRPIVINLKQSKSIAVPKNNIDGQKKKALFGFEKLQIPVGTPSIHLLEFLDEKQLLEVNKKIIALYQKEITAKNIEHYKKHQDEKYESRQ